MEKNKKVKSIKINAELHKRLKMESVKREISIYELIEEIINGYFKEEK